LRSNPCSTSLPEELDRALAQARDRLGLLATRTLHFPTIGSTNDVAASLAGTPDAVGTVVMADAQTAGRGRRGRVWFSPPASGLYMSVVLAPGRSSVDPDRATSLVTLAAGVAIAEGIEHATGLLPALKWPNDVHLGRRKLAGILAETVPVIASRQEALQVVLGYGINVGPMAYPPELRDRATSLESELGRPIDRAVVCVETLCALSARYRDLLDGRFDSILDAWRRLAPSHRNARVSWETPAGVQAGLTEGIDDTGALLIRTEGRVERIVAGEVNWLY
jgi:BirA family biotin operon repressor/biotin-[acetyl-CoA-carboxylase] ligase